MEYITILFGIVIVDLLLSGDNALIIALACRRLDEHQRKKAIVWGVTGAIVLRVLLTFFTVYLLKIPYVHIVGGILLVWIAIKLILVDANHNSEHNVQEAHGLLEAVKTIIVADFVMSMDNVIALAGVSKGNTVMLFLGLAISIPLIVWGSKLILWLMDKYPVIIVIGAAFLGWTAGEMVVSDQSITTLSAQYAWMNNTIPILFVVIVLFSKWAFKQKKLTDNS